MILKDVLKLFDYYHDVDVKEIGSSDFVYRYIPRPGMELEQGNLTPELLNRSVVGVDSIGKYKALITIR